jgi:hypothetical protein
MALIFNMAFFLHLFREALAFVSNFKMQKFLHILEEQTQKKKNHLFSKMVIFLHIIKEQTFEIGLKS